MSDERLLPDDLLEIMQCPNCTGELTEDMGASQLLCGSCGYRYPVTDGIAVMLLDQAILPD